MITDGIHSKCAYSFRVAPLFALALGILSGATPVHGAAPHKNHRGAVEQEHIPVVGNAVLVAGTVSRLPENHSNGQFSTVESMYSTDGRPHSAVHVCANSIMRHLVAPMRSRVDVFMHSWSYDIEADLRRAWGANLTAAEFEHNGPYEELLRPL